MDSGHFAAISVAYGEHWMPALKQQHLNWCISVLLPARNSALLVWININKISSIQNTQNCNAGQPSVFSTT